MADETKKAGGTDAAQEPQETQEIQKAQEVKENYNPKLDPRSPEFDKEAWKQANKGKSLTELLMSVSPDNYKLTYTDETAEEAGKAIAAAADLIAESAKKIAQPKLLEVATNIYKQLEPTFKGVTDAFKNIDFEATRNFVKIAKEFIEALPEIQKSLILNDEYIQEELKKPEYSGVDLEEIYKTDVDENYRVIPGSTLDKILSAVEKRQEKEEKAKQSIAGSGVPQYFKSPNTILSNTMLGIDGKGELINAGAQDLPVINIGSEKEITIFVNVSLDEEKISFTGKPYTEYDKAVHDAVYSFYHYCVTEGKVAAISVEMLYRILTHKTKKEFIGKSQTNSLIECINKLLEIKVEVDATEEMKKRKIVVNPKAKGDERYTFKFRRPLLTATEILGANDEVKGWIFDEPAQYKYASLTNQVITVKGELLDIKEVDEKGKITDVSLANNNNRIAIRSYLLHRVEVMRHDEKKAIAAYQRYLKSKPKKELTTKEIKDFRKQSRIILLNTLFEATTITSKNTKTNSITYITQVLAYWKAAGSIKNYKERKKGKSIDAIIIEF